MAFKDTVIICNTPVGLTIRGDSKLCFAGGISFLLDLSFCSMMFDTHKTNYERGLLTGTGNSRRFFFLPSVNNNMVDFKELDSETDEFCVSFDLRFLHSKNIKEKKEARESVLSMLQKMAYYSDSKRIGGFKYKKCL